MIRRAAAYHTTQIEESDEHWPTNIAMPSQAVSPKYSRKQQHGDEFIEELFGPCTCCAPDACAWASTAASETLGSNWREWFPVVVLSCMVAVLCSLDRTAMSVAILPMSQRYNWSDSVKGAVSSAFNIGYTITNLYGGYMAATMSPKLVLSVGVVVWSIFTIATPPAAATMWLPALLIVRALMGLGEGVAFPTCQAIIKGWVPTDKRSRSLSLIYSGHQLGSILSLLLSPFIISSMGVSSMFYIYGALGFVWLGVWEPVVSSAPPLTAHNSAAKMQLSDLPWRDFARNKAFWSLMVAHACFGVGYNMGIAWLPTYYNQVYGLNVKQSAFLSIMPWLVMAVGTNASGWIADHLINKRIMNTTRARKLLQTLGSIGPAVCLLYLAVMPQTGNLSEAVLLMTLTMGLLGLQSGGFASNHQDISTKYASVLYGITNATASLAGSACVYGVGVILDATHSWSLVFQLVSICYFISAAVYLLCATSEPQFE